MAELDAGGGSSKWTQTTNIGESEDALRRGGEEQTQASATLSGCRGDNWPL